jgi:4-amino-4-deoxy-L-arabinose transferase-like glycosyltransferase
MATRTATAAAPTSRRWIGVSTAALLHYLTLCFIIGVGAWLRLTGLSRQSLWFDEIDVVVRADRPMDQVLRTFVREGENGPLYNLLLAIWVRMAGISETAVRFPSAVAGVLAIPLIYLLARRVVGPVAGLFSAGLLAISPYHVWYSQEAKMYSLVVLLALASTLALAEALERNRARWWVGWVVITSLMFYMHVTSVLVFAAQVGYLLLAHRRWPGRGRAMLLAVAALTLPYVPIALWALRVVGGEVATWHADVGLWEALRVFGIKFAVNRAESINETRGALLFLALAIGGLVALLRRGERGEWWLLLALSAALPVVGLYLVSLRQSVFSDRYAIVALSAYLILVAAGVAFLVRSRNPLASILGVVAIFLLVSAAWQPLRDVNRSTQAQKEDWRSAWADVARRDEPGDAFLLQPGYIITTVEYFNQRLPELRGHAVVTIPPVGGESYDRDALLARLRERSNGATRLWLIQSPDRVALEDRRGRVSALLDELGTIHYQAEVNGVRLTLYEMPVGW